MNSLYILDSSPFSDVFFGNIFLPVCGLSLHSLDIVFCRTKVLNLMKFKQYFLQENIFKTYQNNEKLQYCNKTEGVFAIR